MSAVWRLLSAIGSGLNGARRAPGAGLDHRARSVALRGGDRSGFDREVIAVGDRRRAG
jgi:hypothetical protein